MSMHETPLTELERTGLEVHGLRTDEPCQLSDAFRLGIAWANMSEDSRRKQIERHEENKNIRYRQRDLEE